MIFSIGTSNRSFTEFVTAIQAHSITHLVDVRSSPSSRYPWFNRGMIEHWAERACLYYRYEGSVLGGRSGYGVTDPEYSEALDRIVAAAGRENVAIFCAEGDPARCHRSFEVSASLLARYGLITRQICRDGTCEDATDTLRRTAPQLIPDILKDRLSEVLFAPELGLFVRQNSLKKLGR